MVKNDHMIGRYIAISPELIIHLLFICTLIKYLKVELKKNKKSCIISVYYGLYSHNKKM